MFIVEKESSFVESKGATETEAIVNTVISAYKMFGHDFSPEESLANFIMSKKDTLDINDNEAVKNFNIELVDFSEKLELAYLLNRSLELIDNSPEAEKYVRERMMQSFELQHLMEYTEAIGAKFYNF